MCVRVDSVCVGLVARGGGGGGCVGDDAMRHRDCECGKTCCFVVLRVGGIAEGDGDDGFIFEEIFHLRIPFYFVFSFFI